MGKLLISFSGGRTSAFMTWWLLNKWSKRNEYEMKVVFANTGREKEETLEFVNNCDKYFHFNTVWVEAVVNNGYRKGTTSRVTNFIDASRNGEPFEQVISKYGIPNVKYPHCSRELKTVPIKSYCKSIGWKDYETAIGIRYDEMDRINWENYKKLKLFYPLCTELKITKSDINKFWSNQPFDLNIKSYQGNCKDCWKKSRRKLLTIAKEDPSVFDWTKNMEVKYGEFIPNNRNPLFKPPVRFFRGNLSVKDIIEQSRLPFTPATDDSKHVSPATLFDDLLDSNYGCSETCEPF